MKSLTKKIVVVFLIINVIFLIDIIINLNQCFIFYINSITINM